VSYNPNQPPVVGPQYYQRTDGAPIVIPTKWAPGSAWATWALVSGLITLFGGFLFVLPAVAAVVCGHKGLRETQGGVRRGHGSASFGVAIGYAVLVAWVAFFVAQIIGPLL
jgi:hypothetical protein